MADDVNPTPAQPDKSNEAPQMPQIQIMPKPEPLKIDLSKAKAEDKAQMPSVELAPLPATKPVEKKEEKNVFTQLFGDDKVMQSADLMGSVNKQEDRSKKSVFKKKPTLKSIKESKAAKKPSRVGNTLLKVSILVLILVTAGAYSQNNADFTLFGTNPAEKAVVAQEELVEVEAEVMVQKHLTAVLLLDQFSATADSYLYNLGQSDSDLNSSNKQADYEEAAAEQELEALKLLASIQNSIDTNVSTEHKVAANTLVSELITALEAKTGEVDEATLSQDISDLQTARSLIQNDEFRALLAGANLEEMGEKDIEALLADYTTLNKSVHAVIGSIRNERMKWSQYFDEIETLTKKVDPLFNTEFTGSIKLSDIRFDEGAITISGETSTDDTKNFTLVSNYIDTLESSSSFENVEERSYSKNAGEEDFTGQFRISLELE